MLYITFRLAEVHRYTAEFTIVCQGVTQLLLNVFRSHSRVTRHSLHLIVPWLLLAGKVNVVPLSWSLS